MRRSDKTGALRQELEQRIKTGRCVYCRAPAAPDRPLTREHVIPRARGGGRKDTRIIVPACVDCNQRRGCQEVVLFLLARPRRIAAFLDYLSNLPPHTVREMDLRVFAELYAAVWLLGDSTAWGGGWRQGLRHLCAGRRLHRRRYAARRIVSSVGGRLERVRERTADAEGPTCLLPWALPAAGADRHGGALARSLARLVGALAVVWDVPAERVLEELERERARIPDHRLEGAVPRGIPVAEQEDEGDEDDGVLSLEEARRRRQPRRRRSRVDRRGGRGPRGQAPRGRAA